MADSTVNTYRDFSFASQENYPVISNIEFLLEPQLVKTLFNVNPLQTDLGDFMKMGLMEKVEGEEIIHREERKIIDAPFINQSTTQANVYGTASIGNGDPAAFAGLDYIQLATSAHTPGTGALTNTLSYPRAGMLIEFRGQYFWRIQGKRESVANAHRLYITKMDASYPALSGTITLIGSTYGGDQITLPAPAFEEATYGQQQGLLTTHQNIRSYLTEFSELYQTTNKQMFNKTYPIEDPQSGQTINFYRILGAERTEQRFLVQEAMGIFAVPRADANAVAYDPISGTNKSLSTTSGYIPTLVANAAQKQYGDTITLNLFKDLYRLRNALNQEGDSMMMHGPEVSFRVSDLITQLGVNGSLVYNRTDVDLGISRVSIPGASTLLKPLRILDNPQLTNLPGRVYPWYFIVKPMTVAQDPKTGVPLEAFTIMYKQQAGGGSMGHYKVWMTGALAPVPTSSQQVLNTHYASEKGCRVVGAKAHILGVPDTSLI